MSLNMSLKNTYSLQKTLEIFYKKMEIEIAYNLTLSVKSSPKKQNQEEIRQIDDREIENKRYLYLLKELAHTIVEAVKYEIYRSEQQAGNACKS